MPFRNEPFTDFSQPENIAAQQEALARVEARLGEEIPLVIDGERVMTKAREASYDPSDRARVVGTMSVAEESHIERALQVAAARFDEWRRVPASHRARILLRAAAIMRRRRFELNAWMIFEVGKSWAEADGDTAESIDFLEFYGQEMMALDGPVALTPFPGEENQLKFIPMGPVAVIPPWNFPNAIACGMTAAAVVCGNTAILKPAEQSPIIAYRVFEILEEAGLPKGVCQFLTGDGAVVGERMVTDPRTRIVAFTGSKAVGLGIAERCGRSPKGQRWLKRAVLEMGGKDATVVDADCDFQSAVVGTVQAAFGFQGQKCSAGSRAIVHEKIYDAFVEAVVKEASKLKMGHPRDREVQIGAVIDGEAFERIASYIEIGKTEGRIVLGGNVDDSKGWFIEPTVIADCRPQARVSQEEIFGPVLSIIRARNFENALEIANGTEYGLTGAVYSNIRAHLELARQEYHVGNLYLNRKCTGALVGVQPFGGFNMSGTDSKAGSREYLLLFTQAKAISERF